MTSISLDGVSVALGGRHVVDGISERVRSGEWVTLIGPNGAGKSTLLRAIGGLIECEGSIELGGEPVSGLGRRDLAQRLAFGAGFLVLVDLVARTVVAPAQLPIGVVTAFLGAPFFAVVLRTTRTVGP